MLQVRCETLGDPEVLVLVEVPDPEPGPGRLVVAVEAAGVNYVDALFVAGRYQIKPPLPFVPGSEVAGTVTAVGAGVGDPAVGDRVVVMCGLGGYASHVEVPAAAVVAVPDQVSSTVAAALVQSYATALFALRTRARLDVGETLLVLGGAGGVGSAAIDVGRALGARVLAAASSETKRAACLAVGAEAVIDYTTEDLKSRARELSGGGVDVVFDPVGGPWTEPALRALGLFGRLVVIGFAAGDIPRIPLNQVLLRNRAVVGVDWGAWALANPVENQQLLGELLGWVVGGRLRPGEPTAYPLARAAEALDDLLGRRLVGKAVLVP